MRALGGEFLLKAWDEGLHEHDLIRAVIILSLALPERDHATLAELPLVKRDALLLQLHQLTFGPTLTGVGTCPRCSARFEFTVSAKSLLDVVARPSPEIAEWLEDGVSYRLRRVNTADLLALRTVLDRGAAQRALVARCLEADGRPVNADSDEIAGVTPFFESLHASAELRFTVECSICAATETLDLDVARFLWLEVRNAAQLLLRDIRDLAAAFGWSEAAISRMSAQRRNAYLELASA